MKSHIFDPFGPIDFIAFLYICKLACNTNGIHEDAAFWLFRPFLHQKSVSAVLNMIPSKYKAQTRIPSAGKTTTLSSCPQAVDYLLRTYPTNKNIVTTMMRFPRFLYNTTELYCDTQRSLWQRNYDVDMYISNKTWMKSSSKDLKSPYDLAREDIRPQ